MFTIMFVFWSCMLMAQSGNPEQKEAMRKLRWMIGSWAGTSEVNVDSDKIVTNIRETVESSLDGTILKINVFATDRDSVTRRRSLAYTSFSVISYNLKEKKYRWTTWRNNTKYYDEHSFQVGDNSFEYTTEENGGQTRYKAHLGEKGEFLETGEYAKDGSAWGQFITMKLYKIRR